MGMKSTFQIIRKVIVFPDWSFSSQKLVYREETSVMGHGLYGRKLI